MADSTESDGFSEILLETVRGHDLDHARGLIERGANPQYVDTNGNFPLNAAIRGGSHTMVDFLLDELHVNVNQAHNGLNALHGAVNMRDIGMVKKLLAAGANLEQTTPGRPTPEELARATGEEAIADLLAQTRAERQLQQNKAEMMVRGDAGAKAVYNGLADNITVQKPLKVMLKPQKRESNI